MVIIKNEITKINFRPDGQSSYYYCFIFLYGHTGEHIIGAQWSFEIPSVLTTHEV